MADRESEVAICLLEFGPVLPILEILYHAEERNSHHVYMALIILLILTEDDGFNRSIHEVVSKEFKNIIQRSAPRPDSYEWQGVWDSMGKCLGRWAPPVFWNFTPEQVQNPEKLVDYLEKVCCHPGNSKEIQITAMCWGLAHAYRALFNTIQNPQGSGDKMTGTVATPDPCDR
ncbi:hypothetical protein QYF61_022143 [Mycteria americana]|uniref:Dymeclin n=1 Tax=Mycteria americana TaxID=33587 RepID=A0AAN7RWD6_MYCAM|nr:hypothetical protein QYF61_022143 [Mycteria americana]